jgi:hypothetical protein
MAQRFDSSYRVARGDNLGDPDYWNVRLKDLDLRLHARELDADNIAHAADDLVAAGLQRLNDSIAPVLQQTAEEAAQIAALSAQVEAALAGGVDDGTF